MSQEAQPLPFISLAWRKKRRWRSHAPGRRDHECYYISATVYNIFNSIVLILFSTLSWKPLSSSFTKTSRRYFNDSALCRFQPRIITYQLCTHIHTHTPICPLSHPFGRRPPLPLSVSLTCKGEAEPPSRVEG